MSDTPNTQTDRERYLRQLQDDSSKTSEELFKEWDLACRALLKEMDTPNE